MEKVTEMLAALKARISHADDCATVAGVAGEYHFIPGACSCDREARVDAATVRGIERAIDVACDVVGFPDPEGKAAALAALEREWEI